MRRQSIEILCFNCFLFPWGCVCLDCEAICQTIKNTALRDWGESEIETFRKAYSTCFTLEWCPPIGLVETLLIRAVAQKFTEFCSVFATQIYEESTAVGSVRLFSVRRSWMEWLRKFRQITLVQFFVEFRVLTSQEWYQKQQNRSELKLVRSRKNLVDPGTLFSYFL